MVFLVPLNNHIGESADENNGYLFEMAAHCELRISGFPVGGVRLGDLSLVDGKMEKVMG